MRFSLGIYGEIQSLPTQVDLKPQKRLHINI